MLKEFGTIEFTEGWTRSVLKSLNWSKGRATTGKVEPSAQLLAEEKSTFQKAVAKTIQDNDIPPDLVINTFHFKGSKHVPVKGVDDERQITATFGMSAVGEFLPNASHLWGGETKFARNSASNKIIFSVVHGKSLVQYLKIRGVFHEYCISVLGKI